METFTTHITFTSGDRHKETTREDQLGSTITRLVRGPAALLGLIKEVKIVDTYDCIVFLARDGKVVFPEQKTSK
jgi:hypothetical protein